jgi:hypothetical protein
MLATKAPPLRGGVDFFVLGLKRVVNDSFLGVSPWRIRGHKRCFRGGVGQA